MPQTKLVPTAILLHLFPLLPKPKQLIKDAFGGPKHTLRVLKALPTLIEDIIIHYSVVAKLANSLWSEDMGVDVLLS